MVANRKTALRDRMRARVKATRAACALCGEPINYDLPHSDPKSFVIDHIESLHEGGADALSNIQAAHRRPATATVPKGQNPCDQPSVGVGPSTRTTLNQGAVSLSNSPLTLRGLTVFTHGSSGTDQRLGTQGEGSPEGSRKPLRV